MSSMTPLQLCRKLKLSETAMDALANLSIDDNTAARLKAAFQESQELFEAEACREDNADLLVLALYLRWSVETYVQYALRGIDREIFFNSFRDLTIWSDAFEAENGRPGLKVWGWCARTVRMQLFRLGRLQFQPDVLTEDLTVGEECYRAGTRVLQVHIPAGEKLTPEAVEASLGCARDFFRTYYGMEHELFTCRSWLLSPALEELLEEDSNILRFKRRFTLWGTEAERQAEERVFRKVLDDAAGYPEHTTLQRKLKQYLLSGKKADMGCGIIRCRDVEEIR